MNFNASRNVGQSEGLRKAKRVSDVTAMGAPSPLPGYGPGPAFDAGFPPTGPPPPYQEGIQLEPNQDFGSTSPAPNFGFMASGNSIPGNPMGGMGAYPQAAMGMTSPGQIGSMLQQPVVRDMAFQYGNQLASQGRIMVQKEIQRYVPVSQLKYYFAVDTRYVMKKLMLIMFPYTHKDWVVKYDQDTPVQPRYDINAPDLYIPSMGYVTYVLLAGFMLGLQHRFSPEQIGIQASSALAYIIFEMMLYLVTLYITNTNTNLKTLDLLAYSGYKYITMIGGLLGGLILGKTGYYCCLVYSSVALSYFLVKTLRVQVLAGSIAAPESQTPAYGYGYQGNPYADNWSKPTGGGGTKRRAYFLIFVAITQPLLSWWLTYHLVPTTAAPLPPPVLPTR